jgi:hypothetical protein
MASILGKGNIYGYQSSKTAGFVWDRKLCFQAHDDYFNCIDKLDEKSNIAY